MSFIVKFSIFFLLIYCLFTVSKNFFVLTTYKFTTTDGLDFIKCYENFTIEMYNSTQLYNYDYFILYSFPIVEILACYLFIGLLVNNENIVFYIFHSFLSVVFIVIDLLYAGYYYYCDMYSSFCWLKITPCVLSTNGHLKTVSLSLNFLLLFSGIGANFIINLYQLIYNVSTYTAVTGSNRKGVKIN